MRGSRNLARIHVGKWITFCDPETFRFRRSRCLKLRFLNRPKEKVWGNEIVSWPEEIKSLARIDIEKIMTMDAIRSLVEKWAEIVGL